MPSERRPAQWNIGNPYRNVHAADGKAVISVPLVDDGVKQGTLRIEMTANRELVVSWEQEPGAEPLADFRAWWKAV